MSLSQRGWEFQLHDRQYRCALHASQSRCANRTSVPELFMCSAHASTLPRSCHNRSESVWDGAAELAETFMKNAIRYLVLALTVLGFCGKSQAQGYPSKPV